MAMDGEETLQNETFVSICLAADTRHWDSAYGTNLAQEGGGATAAFDVDETGAQKTCRNSGSCHSSADLDLECGFTDVKAFVKSSEKACRICSFNSESSSPELGVPIVLGCSCKGDLGYAHPKCAETWFNIRGNRICEICESKVKNLVGFGVIESMDSMKESSNNITTAAGTHRYCEGHRLLSCLLGAMLVAIVICWLR